MLKKKIKWKLVLPLQCMVSVYTPKTNSVSLKCLVVVGKLITNACISVGFSSSCESFGEVRGVYVQFIMRVLLAWEDMQDSWLF